MPSITLVSSTNPVPGIPVSIAKSQSYLTNFTQTFADFFFLGEGKGGFARAQ